MGLHLFPLYILKVKAWLNFFQICEAIMERSCIVKFVLSYKRHFRSLPR